MSRKDKRMHEIIDCVICRYEKTNAFNAVTLFFEEMRADPATRERLDPSYCRRVMEAANESPQAFEKALRQLPPIPA